MFRFLGSLLRQVDEISLNSKEEEKKKEEEEGD